MAALNSFRAIIELWGPRDAHGARLALASEIGATGGMVTKWFQRNSIPAEYWSALLLTERARSSGVTADLLTELAAREAAEEVRA